MNQSEYTYLQVKKWRAIGYDWNILSTYNQSSRLYCLTDFQVAWLLSNTEYMRWSTRWIDCPCSQQDLDAMKAELEYNLMSCFDFQPYQLDYLYEDALNRAFQEFNVLYDEGGIEELNPNTPTDYYSGDGSDAREGALCMACETYVKSYAQRWLQQAQLINGALNFIIGIVVPVPYISTIAIEVIAGLIGVDQDTVSAMQDNDALDAVTCCMRDGLNGGAVNQTTFEESLDGCAFDPESNAEIVRSIISSDIDVFDNWLSFLDALGNAYTYTSKGIVFACPCDNLSWTSTFDFSTGQQGWTVADSIGWTPLTRGVFSTDKWIAGNNQSAFSRARGVYIEFASFDETHITEVEITYSCTKGTVDSGVNYNIMSLIHTDATSENKNFNEPITNGTAKVETVEFTDDKESNRILINGYCMRTNPSVSYNGQYEILQIVIRGTGTKPSQFP